MRPFVFINAAMSIDGRITDWRRRQVRISCRDDMKRVDRLRAESDAVLVGIGTVIADNPSLTVKSKELREKRIKEGKSPNPVRVVLDSKARLPLNSNILSNDAETLVAVSKMARRDRINLLKDVAKVVVCGEKKVDIPLLLNVLFENGIRKLMVEGGGRVISSFLKEKVVDRLFIYVGGIAFGEGVNLVEGRLDPPVKFELLKAERVGRGFVLEANPVYKTEATDMQ
jgi:2,5-diamino-6-(ribosylamino)-4(3H)-pyrimidinone 5'-phosphate reductase